MPYDPGLAAIAGSYGSIFSGQYQPRQPQFNLGSMIPGMGGAGGMALNMLAGPLLSQFAQTQGILGLQFSGTQNLYDTMQAQQLFMERSRAMRQAAMGDRQQLQNTLQNMTRMATGRAPDQQEIAAAGRLAGDLSGMLPVMAMMDPHMVDQMFGRRGSQTVMAQHILMGSRGIVDPVTGLPGLTGDSAATMAGGLYKNLYGTDAAVAQMRGIGAGQAGQMYDELNRRGFLGGMGNLGQGSMGMGPDQARQAEVSRVADRLRGAAKAVSVMKDIFGDEGHPNAPMRELMNGLQALTQGGMATMDPAKLEQSLRLTQQLSRTTGVSIAGVLQMNAQAAGVTDRLGLDRQFAVGATQSALAYSIAFGNSKYAGVTGFGLMDKEALMSQDQQMILAATASPVGRQLAAVMHLRDSNKNRIDPKSDFAKMAAAIERGETSFTDSAGNKKDLGAMGFREVTALAKGAGIDEGEVLTALRSPHATQYAASKYNTGLLARQFQGRDLDAMIRTQLMNAGMKDDMAIKAVAALRALSPADQADPSKRPDAIFDAIRTAGMTPDQEKEMRAQLGRGLLNAEEIMGDKRLPFNATFGGTLANGIRVSDQGLLNQRQAAMAIMASRGKLASAFSGLGQAGFARNFFDYLSANKDPTLEGFVGSVFGGSVNVQDVIKHLQGQGKEFQGIVDTWKDIAKAPPEQQGALIEEMRKKMLAVGPRLDTLDIRSRKALRSTLAQNDGTMIQALSAAGIKSSPEMISKMLSGMSEEGRYKLFEAADKLRDVDKDMKDAAGQDMKPFKEFKDRLDSAQRGELKLSPDTKLQLVDSTLKLDKDGSVKLSGGYLTPAAGRNTQAKA